MRQRLQAHRFAVHVTALVLFVVASAGLYFAPGHGLWPLILLGVAALGALLTLLV